MKLGLGQSIAKGSRKTGGGGSPYQSWAGYPDSPVLTADYPLQFIWVTGGNTYVHYSTFECYKDGTTWMRTIGTSPKVVYYQQLVAGAWNAAVSTRTDQWNMGTATPDIPERNYNIYAEEAKTNIKYAKNA